MTNDLQDKDTMDNGLYIYCAADLIGYESDGAAAMDLKAVNPAFIKAGETKLVGTGVYLVRPNNRENYSLILPRSSFGKIGIIIPNSPGLIDADYRGEIKVLLTNLGSETFYITAQDRIAQILFHGDGKDSPVFIDFKQFMDFNIENPTTRGSGGFGSTGK